MVRKVSHKELSQLLDIYYEKKKALLVYGSFGIGKSDSVRVSANSMAKAKNKTYVEWNKLAQKDKDDVFIHPEKYFVLLDMRMSEFDPTDIKGLPDYKDKDSIDWKPIFN